jgi:hypothetical protein
MMLTATAGDKSGCEVGVECASAVQCHV